MKAHEIIHCPKCGASITNTTLGRQFGSAGGKARKRALSPERRREIALKAIHARWSKPRIVESPKVEEPPKTEETPPTEGAL